MSPKTEVRFEPDKITTAQLLGCVSLYPKAVEKFYQSKIKDEKKLKVALENDKWRFDELPKLVENRSDALGKVELERLVQWKITHGVYRPFLPGMVRKNDATLVKSQTTAAVKLLSTLPQNTTDAKAPEFSSIVKQALGAICKLQGVGPATGTLILNVYNPTHVPFFQDELFMWLFPKHDKLKYNDKEYLELFQKVWDLRQRAKVTAGELEKAAFVIMHMDLLGPADRTLIEKFKSDDTTVEHPEIDKPAKKRAKEIEDDQEEEAKSAPKRRTKRTKA